MNIELFFVDENVNNITYTQYVLFEKAYKRLAIGSVISQ